MPEQTTLRDAWGNLAVTLSCKAIVRDGDAIWLRKNERGDWELPGGRLDEGEQPEQTIVREIREELGLELVSPRLVDMYIWKKDFGTTTHVGIVTFMGGRALARARLNYRARLAVRRFRNTLFMMLWRWTICQRSTSERFENKRC
ncbi:MAG: NUDIX hydrolase [Candidatus Saccharibacteria bacterium]|nr:NUDIX hydrolase [Candidatus Saccharibacteria bacterium]